MKLSPRDISSFLNHPDRNGVRAVVIYGPNQGKVRDHAKTICSWAVPDMKDAFAVTEIQADSYDSQTVSLADEMNAMNMMGGRRLVYIRQATDKISADIKQAISDYSGDNYMLIEAGELTPRSSLRKLAESQNNMAALACYDESPAELASMLIEKLAAQGFEADYDVRQFFTTNYVGNRMQAEAELDKIMAYVGYPKGAETNKITLADVQACTGNRAEQTLDILIHATMDGDFITLEKSFHTLIQEGANEVQILRSLQNYIARLQWVHVQMKAGASQGEATKKLQPPLFFKNKPIFEKHLRSWSLLHLDKAMDRLLKTEGAIKQTGVPTQQLTHRTLMAIAHQARSLSAKSA